MHGRRGILLVQTNVTPYVWSVDSFQPTNKNANTFGKSTALNFHESFVTEVSFSRLAPCSCLETVLFSCH